MKERLSAILAMLMSIKICCIIPWLLAVTGIGGSVSGEVMDNVQMFTLPFIAWPAVLFANWRFWNGLRLSKKNGIQLNYKLVGMNFAVTIIASFTFVYFFITQFVPLATAPRVVVCTTPTPDISKIFDALK